MIIALCYSPRLHSRNIKTDRLLKENSTWQHERLDFFGLRFQNIHQESQHERNCTNCAHADWFRRHLLLTRPDLCAVNLSFYVASNGGLRTVICRRRLPAEERLGKSRVVFSFQVVPET